MSSRISPAVTFMLLLSVLGCGQVHRSLAPETDSATGSPDYDPASLAKLEAAEAAFDAEERALDGEDGDRMGWHAHATPIRGQTVITRPGDYRLDSDLEIANGDGIVITASHVRLWLGDHRLRGPGNKLGRAVVIDGARNVLVRGGRVERFGLGAVILGSSECRIRGLDIHGGDETADPATGNPPQIGIMLVNSSKNHISRSRLRGVNLGIFVRGGGSYENVIRKNLVEAGDHGLLGICYNPAPNAGPVGPHNDLVAHNLLNRFGTGIQTSAQSSSNLFRSNTIRYFNSAYEDLNGTNVFVRNRSRQIVP